jgi:hypothetical protein
METNFFIASINAFSNFLLPQAFAAKEIIINKDLKDNKLADYAGDLDKLGIIGGAAIILISYIAGWKIPFLSSITATASSRAITFGVQSAIAFAASVNFNKGAKLIIARLDQADELLNQVGGELKLGLDQLVISDETSSKVGNILAKARVVLPKPLNQMTIRETTEFLEGSDANPKLTTEDKMSILEFTNGLKEKANQYDKKI